jgi:hypothetical protein
MTGPTSIASALSWEDLEDSCSLFAFCTYLLSVVELRLGRMFDSILFRIVSGHRTEINRDTLHEQVTIT